MPTVTVTFEGICTFISKSSVDLPTGVLERVVLVNASEPREIAGLRIGPHQAVMTIDGGEVIPLGGATVSITPAVGQLIKTSAFTTLLPNLSQLVGSLAPLGPPSPAVVTGRDPELAACYFDIDSGTLDCAADMTGAVSSTLTMSREDGEGFELVVTRFDGTEVTTIRLERDAKITIANECSESDAQMADFFLHYLLAEKMPPAPQLPPVLPTHGVQTWMLVGGGCSNSTYP